MPMPMPMVPSLYPSLYPQASQWGRVCPQSYQPMPRLMKCSPQLPSGVLCAVKVTSLCLGLWPQPVAPSLCLWPPACGPQLPSAMPCTTKGASLWLCPLPCLCLWPPACGPQPPSGCCAPSKLLICAYSYVSASAYGTSLCPLAFSGVLGAPKIPIFASTYASASLPL